MSTGYLDLNTVSIGRDSVGGMVPVSQKDHSFDGILGVYFKGIKGHLLRKINEAYCVLGCVAWLTDPDILAALAARPGGACILIQKEDFLRPDGANAGSAFKREIREAYSKLKFPLERHMLPAPYDGLSCASGVDVDPVRVVGVKNNGRASPRMHHKFAVFASAKLEGDPEWDEFTGCMHCNPYEVWTGSFNWTRNATRSLENAMSIDHPQVVEAYFKEWLQVLSMSEPLNWESEYIEPEWRFGT